jgi:CubicO group peptidase (beta-lactamase class C family)
MKYVRLYRALIRLLPAKQPHFCAIKQAAGLNMIDRMQSVLERHKASGGVLAMFDARGLTGHYVYGEARKGVPVNAETAFRLASVSKTVTAAGILAMKEQGLIDLDSDADIGLPYTLRHPLAPDRPITLRMLLTHTAGIRDGRDYLRGITNGTAAPVILKGDSHTAHLPGTKCEYSNFGMGLAGCVVEACTGLSFQEAMDRYLFKPLNLKASFYPQLLSAVLADARRILPSGRMPNFDGAKRQAVPEGDWRSPDPQRHHLLAHGSCCMDAESLSILGRALMRPGFLAEETLAEMRAPHASLKNRDPHLQQGLGIFLLKDESLSPSLLYGHQGMAYGAVQMMFFDPLTDRGFLSLTTGVSEARTHILADVNRALLREWLQND